MLVERNAERLHRPVCRIRRVDHVQLRAYGVAAAAVTLDIDAGAAAAERGPLCPGPRRVGCEDVALRRRKLAVPPVTVVDREREALGSTDSLEARVGWVEHVL